MRGNCRWSRHLPIASLGCRIRQLLDTSKRQCSLATMQRLVEASQWGNIPLMDTLTKEQRSERMSRVRNKDSKPEMKVRRLAHSMGYRYRLHSRRLPGHPDMVFGGRRKVIFVHGCFWHRHGDCPLTRLPKTRLEFWLPKLEGNKVRDANNQARLHDLGWEFLVIWECEVKDTEALRSRLATFLGPPGNGTRNG
jgi:DNA mismatch endonuclease (patch repair protein)